jgi:hypothetical protein
MNWLYITIFLLSTITAFGVLCYSAWEAQTETRMPVGRPPMKKISVRQMERYMLYFLRHFLQLLVLLVVKYWFLALTKAKKFIVEKLPKFHTWLKSVFVNTSGRPSFFSRMSSDLKVKISHMKDNIKKDHEI